MTQYSTTTTRKLSSKDSLLTPLKVYKIPDPIWRDHSEPFSTPTNTDNADNSPIPIAIDFGTDTIKAGYTNSPTPALVFPTLLSRFRDRKLRSTYTFIGNDTDLDSSIKNNSKTPFDGPFISNWDYVEDILEYIFNHLSVNQNNNHTYDGVPNDLILTERLGNVLQQRTNWYQLIFECFNIPRVTFGIDSLFSYYYNSTIYNENNGLIINSGNVETDVIPVVNGKGIISEAKRLSWGGSKAINYLSDLLSLKYPYFPDKLSNHQFKYLYENFSYVSQNYEEELDNFLNLEYLETHDIVVESSFNEVIPAQKTQEELDLQAAKKRELAKKLQEQAKLKRQEKLVEKQQEYEYYSNVKEQLKDQPKQVVLSTLRNANFDDEKDFNKYLYNLKRSIQRATSKDLEDAADDEDGENSTNMETAFNLVDVPDEQLDNEQIKEKRKQKLLKANYDARQRIKQEKLKELELKEEMARKDKEWRETDLNAWIKDKRHKLNSLIKGRKGKLKLQEDMKDRKSQSSQRRMKNLTALADDQPSTGNGKRSRSHTQQHQQTVTIDNDPNDTFGANDDDWLIYKEVGATPESLDEAIEEEYKKIIDLEKILLEHDPNFTEEDTLDAQYDWRNSILHLFLRGPRPHDSEDSHQQHQMHLNVERIRVPEILFEPSIAGLDQAGVSELSKRIVLGKFGSSNRELSEITETMAQNILITGGHGKLPQLRERIVKDFEEFMPMGSKFNIRMAQDPILDSWKGMAKFAQSSQYAESFITKRDYEEYGPEYIKEHNLSNVRYYD
ncbi:probable Actin-related protein 5 [Saccharomycodes ludwigii]|uniref:Probable Actin-related protein 5 n=1 Tax=Saccharomycodes ludwigii TaxID=36035 RepID=A0A376B5X0_9ASCO|nr:probable Actin-related protein 5 [Saccharomycodes ludwigii]